MLAVLTVAAACGSSPGAPSRMLFETSVLIVSAFSPQVGLAQVALTVANGPEQQSDAAGKSVIQAESQATVPVRLRHPAFVERETSVRIPDTQLVNLSLIPSTHDMTAFEEFSPRAAGLQRWTRNPRLLVLSHAVDYAGAALGFREYPVVDRPISQPQLDCLVSGAVASLAEMSGGHLTFDSVDIARVAPGSRFRTDETPEGTIAVLPTVSLVVGGRAIGYVGAEPFVLSRGAVWLNADTQQNFCFTELIYRHEMGHALGYQHVTHTVSMMSEFLPAALTDFDRNSIAILFQRRPGNRLPDRDPSGVSVNFTASGAPRDVEPMR
jgi:hypothetical protein